MDRIARTHHRRPDASKPILRTAVAVLGAVTALHFTVSSPRSGARSITPAAVRAADGPSIAVQQWGGAVTGVAADGDTAYVAIGPRLAVVDVTDAATPRIIGRSAPVDDVVTHPFVHGGHVVALGQNHGLVVFDVSDPMEPLVAGRVAALGRSTDLDVVGDRAYVCDDKGGLRIVDLTDPAAPTILAEWTPSDGSATTAAAAGDHVFVGVTSEPPELVVLDVGAVPPTVVARIELPGLGGPRDIALAPGWAYVALGAEVIAFDVADPEAPAIAEGVTDGVDTIDVLAADGDVLWAAGSSTAYTLDVRDPAFIALRSVFELDNNLYAALDVDGQRAYIADSAGLHIVAIGDPLMEPVIAVGEPGRAPDGDDPGARPLGLARHDGYVLVASGTYGLRVLDASAPITATEVARVPIVPGADPNIGTTAVVIDGDRAFTSEDALGGGLRVIDVSDPLQPGVLGSIAAPGKSGRPAVAGDLVAMPTAGTDAGGVRLYRIAPDGQPSALGWLDLGAGCDIAALAGTRLYVGGFEGLFVVDITDPAAPVRLGAAPEIAAWGGIVVTAPDRLLVADVNFGLFEIDTADPTSPTIVGRVPMTGGADDLVRRGDELWVANNYAGVTRLALTAGTPLRATGRWFVDEPVFAVAPEADAVWLRGADAVVALDPGAASMPRIVGTLASPGFLVRTAIANGRIAAVSSWDIDRREVHVLMDGMPIAPLGSAPLGPLGDIETPGDALALSNGVSWVPAGGYGLIGYDTRNPSAIRRLTAHRNDRTLVLENVVVTGTLAFGLAQRDVVVLDLADPVHPTVVGRTTLRRGTPTGVAVAGRTAWVLATIGDASDLNAFDFSQPTALAEIGRWPLPAAATDLSVEGDRLVIAGGEAGLLVWDIERPVAAYEATRLPFVGAVEGVALANGVAWTVEPGSAYRVSAVDLDAAAGPSVLASTALPDWAEADIDADGLTAVVANGHAGLYVLHLLDRPAAPSSPATPTPTATARPQRLFLPAAFIGRPEARVTLALDRSAAMALAADDGVPAPAGPAGPVDPATSAPSRLDVAQRLAGRLAARLGASNVRVSLIAYDGQAERLPSSGAAAVAAALAGLAVDVGSTLAASARHDVALAAVAADLAGAPERCQAAVVITAGRSAGTAADATALARANGLGARGVARFVVRVGGDAAADGAWLTRLAGDALRLRAARSTVDAEAEADRLATALAACP